MTVRKHGFNAKFKIDENLYIDIVIKRATILLRKI